MNNEEKRILYNLINKEIKSVEKEVKMLKKEIEKKRLCKFMDGTTEIVDIDDLTIVTDPEIIGKALREIK